MKITSPSNLRIKKIAKLMHRKTRDLTAQTLVDGIKEVTCAYESGATLPEIYICPEMLEKYGGKKMIELVTSWGIPIYELSPDVIEKISFGDRLEGIVAVCEPKLKVLTQLNLKENPIVVVIEQIEKPGNLGAILRTCDGAGIDALLVSDSKTDLFNPNVIRASIGTIFSVPAVMATNLQILEYLRKNNMTLVAATPSGKETYWNTDLKGPLAIILGSEQQGLSDFWLKEADHQISIPMRGKADSLNVSNTAAILIYEAIRQRGRMI